MDVGLPTLNGIEAALQIRQLVPKSRILFVSENRCGEIVDAAMATGAMGYIQKSNGAKELLPALQALRCCLPQNNPGSSQTMYEEIVDSAVSLMRSDYASMPIMALPSPITVSSFGNRKLGESTM